METTRGSGWTQDRWPDGTVWTFGKRPNGDTVKHGGGSRTLRFTDPEVLGVMMSLSELVRVTWGKVL
ncbi:D-galactonate dehydratase family member protein, partial [Clarias magur]